MPIFSSLRETSKPGTWLPSSSRRSTRNSVIPSWPRVGVGLRHQEDEVRPGAVGDERLRAVDHVLVAVADRLGADPGDVGAGARLGDPEAADLLALDPRHQVALLLLLGARAGGSGAGPCRSGPRSPCWFRRSPSSSCTRRGPASSSSRRPARRTPPGSRGRGSRARRRAPSPRGARWSPPTRCGGGRAPSCTQACIDSRRSSCSSVNSRCLRFAAWSGLMTVAVATASPPLLGGAVARGLARPSARASSIEYYFILCVTLARDGRRAGPLRRRRRRRDGHAQRPREAQPALRRACSPELRRARSTRARDDDDGARRRPRPAPGRRSAPGADLGGFGADAPLIHKHFGTDLFLEFFRLMPRARQAVAVRRQRPRARRRARDWRSPATW